MEEDVDPPIRHENFQGTPPKSILLEVRGYVDGRTNATTVYACHSAGRGAIRVTFWVARPPRVSCFTVHCDGAGPGEFHRFPMVLAAEDDMILLSVTLSGSGHASLEGYSEHFVYQAAGGTSTLRALPDPRPLDFTGVRLCRRPDLPPLGPAGILRLSRGDGFLVAALQVMAGPNGDSEPAFILQLFDSRTWTWTSRWMHVDDRRRFPYFRPIKVLVIGGERGSMGWADLSKGILTCDLLAVDDDGGGAVLRHTPLPPSPETFGGGWPCYVKDIAVVQGRIKFFEMRYKLKRQAITSTTTLVSKLWEATAWEKEMDLCQQWRKDCELDIFKVPVETTSHYELPSHLRDMGKLRGSLPALSLHEEDVVYVMAEADTDPELDVQDRNVSYGKAKKHRAWMLAVDMRKKTLREVAVFYAGRTDWSSLSYLQSGISKYISI